MPFLCDPRPFFGQTSRGKPTQLVDWVLLFSTPFSSLVFFLPFFRGPQGAHFKGNCFLHFFFEGKLCQISWRKGEEKIAWKRIGSLLEDKYFTCGECKPSIFFLVAHVTLCVLLLVAL